MSTSTGQGPSLLHDQVSAQIRRAIADGEAVPGERLPLARDRREEVIAILETLP